MNLFRSHVLRSKPVRLGLEALESRRLLAADLFPHEFTLAQPTLPEDAAVGEVAASLSGPLNNRGLTLLVYPDGSASLKNTNDAPLSFQAYVLTSERSQGGGDLDPTGWKSISDHVPFEIAYLVEHLGTGALTFGEASPGAGNLAELNLGGAAVLQPHAEFAIGKPFAVFPPAVTFGYQPAGHVTQIEGEVVLADPALPPELTFALLDSANGRFRLEGGTLYVNQAAFDHESEPVVTLRLQATEPGGLVHEFDLPIPIGNVNEAPTILASPGTQPVAPGQPTKLWAFGVLDPELPGELATLKPVLATLSVAHGTLELQDSSGLLVTQRSVDGRRLELLGPPEAINLAVQGLVYRSDTGFAGADALAVTINDLGQMGVGPALSTQQNRPLLVLATPFAIADRYYVAAGAVTQGVVIDNDFPLPGSFVELVDGAKYGQLVLQSSGHFTYAAPSNLGLLGADSFRYKLVHPTGDSAVVEVTLYTLAGDANGDGKVDLADYAELKNRFGREPRGADFNGNGRHDLEDFGILKQHFGAVDRTNAALAAAFDLTLAITFQDDDAEARLL